MAKKSLIKNSIFNIIYTLVNLLFPLITSVYISRILLPAKIGTVSYAQNIASYFVTLAILGLNSYGTREVAKVRGNQEKLNQLFTELIVLNTISSTVASIAYTVLVLVNNGMRASLGLYVVCGLPILFNYINVDWLYQGEEEYVYISCRSIVVKIASFFALLVFVKTSSDYVVYALIGSLATGGNYIFNIVHTKKFVSLDFSDLNLKRHLKPNFILAASIFLSTLYNKTDITMLGFMASDEQVGYYSYAHKIIIMAVTAGIAISTVFLPRLSYSYKYDIEEFKRLIKKGTQILSFLLFPMAVGVFVIADEMVRLLFGEAFIASAVTIKIFVPLIFINGFGNLLCYQVVLCTGNERKRLPTYAAGAIINIIINICLIPTLAENGAAIASVISELIVNLYQFIVMRKIVVLPIDKKAVGQAVITSVLMGMVLCLVKIYLSLSGFMIVMILVCIGCLVYIFLNYFIHNELLMQIQKMLRERIKL